LRIEYQREVFRWATRQVRADFESATWEAFWQTAVACREVVEVAEELGKKPGAVYAARSRQDPGFAKAAFMRSLLAFGLPSLC
jgi:hypothetical protein